MVDDHHGPDKGPNYQHLTASLYVGVGLGFCPINEIQPRAFIFLLGTIS